MRTVSRFELLLRVNACFLVWSLCALLVVLGSEKRRRDQSVSLAPAAYEARKTTEQSRSQQLANDLNVAPLSRVERPKPRTHCGRSRLHLSTLVNNTTALYSSPSHQTPCSRSELICAPVRLSLVNYRHQVFSHLRRGSRCRNGAAQRFSLPDTKRCGIDRRICRVEFCGSLPPQIGQLQQKQQDKPNADTRHCPKRLCFRGDALSFFFFLFCLAASSGKA